MAVTNLFRVGDIVTYIGGRTKFRVVSTERSSMVAMERLDGKDRDAEGCPVLTITSPRNVTRR